MTNPIKQINFPADQRKFKSQLKQLSEELKKN